MVSSGTEAAMTAVRLARGFTGRDLIALGQAPGPRFKELLEAVETEQLEGRLTDRQSALEWVKGLL